MNIFVLDLDPRRCARYHCDFHVGKMITETAQILSTVLGGPYKPTHVSHPCVKWAEDGIDNVAWLLALGDALGNEFMYRRGKLHASSLVLNELQRRFTPMLVNIQPPTHFVLAMPKHLRGGALTAPPEHAVERYRAYYNACKQGFWRQPSRKWVPATWEKREVPEWFEVRGLREVQQ